MQISVISTSIETKPTQKGSYQQLEVVYKNLTYQGKVESKKLMSFGANASAFKALSAATPGSSYDITVTKNPQGYNDWTAVAPASGPAPAAESAGKPQTTSSPRSTYETPEERAQRQVFIIRQSSLTNAIATLSVGAKAVKPDDVIALATKYTNFVTGVKDPGPSGFDDLPDYDTAAFEAPQVD